MGGPVEIYTSQAFSPASSPSPSSSSPARVFVFLSSDAPPPFSSSPTRVVKASTFLVTSCRVPHRSRAQACSSSSLHRLKSLFLLCFFSLQENRGKMGKKRGEMEARARSKELLELEQEKPSFLESNIFLCKKEEEESGAAQTNSKKFKKQGQIHGAEETKQQATATVPTSHVLGKVKDFLGVIAQANEKLQRSVQEGDLLEHDIEVLTGDETEYIEMDLLLGVTDLQTPEAVAVAEAAIGGSGQHLPLSDGNSSSDSEENTDEENDHIIADSTHSRSETQVSGSSRPIQSSERPKIMELN